MDLTLERYCYGFAHTLGVLKWPADTGNHLVTLEPPWYLNTPGRSCIPEGHYNLAPFSSPAHGDTWLFVRVPERIGILFHSGNFVSQTEGCVLVGMTEGVIDGQVAVTHSRDAMSRLLALLSQEATHRCEIKQYRPPRISSQFYSSARTT